MSQQVTNNHNNNKSYLCSLLNRLVPVLIDVNHGIIESFIYLNARSRIFNQVLLNDMSCLLFKFYGTLFKKGLFKNSRKLIHYHEQ